MKKRAQYLFRARTHIRDIIHAVNDLSGSTAIAYAVATQLRQQCTRLGTLPGTLGRARPELGHALRSFPCRGYIIIFRYVETGVVIVAILHASRDIIAYFRDDDGT